MPKYMRWEQSDSPEVNYYGVMRGEMLIELFASGYPGVSNRCVGRETFTDQIFSGAEVTRADVLETWTYGEYQSSDTFESLFEPTGDVVKDHDAYNWLDRKRAQFMDALCSDD